MVHSTVISSGFQKNSDILFFFIYICIETLDDLEKIVVPSFKNVQNKYVKKLLFSKNHPWGPKQLRHKISIIPLKDIQALRLSFPVPYVRDKYRSAVSFHYCSHKKKLPYSAFAFKC